MKHPPKRRAPSITSPEKGLIAVGCSHAFAICPVARKAVLYHIDKHAPAIRIHLGDFCDTAAFRSGARGTSDESDPVGPDIDSGLTFLREMRATHVLCGNHEDRLWRMRESPNAVVADAAQKAVQAIEDCCNELGAVLVAYDGVFQRLHLGDTTFCHGTMYGENATRDHAEAFGNVVHAHTHRAALAYGRRSDNPRGIGVGTLSCKREHGYAKARRATLAWSQAYCYGGVTHNSSSLNLCLGPHENGTAIWRLP
jgi:hypothetical protein